MLQKRLICLLSHLPHSFQLCYCLLSFPLHLQLYAVYQILKVRRLHIQEIFLFCYAKQFELYRPLCHRFKLGQCYANFFISFDPFLTYSMVADMRRLKKVFSECSEHIVKVVVLNSLVCREA